MAIIRFSEPTGFLNELKQDLALIDRDIVRVAFLYTPSKEYPTVSHCTLQASCTIQGQLVVLKIPFGMAFEGAPKNLEELGERGKLKVKLEHDLREMGLTVRDGWQEEGE